MKKLKREIIIVSMRDFALMTPAETCKIMESNKNYAIVGSKAGIDRRIIERQSNKKTS